MSGNTKTYVVFLFAVVFTALFHRQALGLNLLIAEMSLMLWLLFAGQFRFRGLLPATLGAGFILTSVFTVVTHSQYSYQVHFIVLFLFAGILVFPAARSLVSVIGQSSANMLLSVANLYNRISGARLGRQNLGGYFRKGVIFILPLLIIILFVIIYRNSSLVFEKMLNDAGNYIAGIFTDLFGELDFTIIFTFILCLYFTVIFLLRGSYRRLTERDAASSDVLARKKKAGSFPLRITAFRNEYRSGVFLLAALNLVLLALNITDIRWVWFGFEWEGQYLKQFVHQGTYLLILSILISIAVVLYYFRGNQNFYSGNKLLRYLSYAWLLQNGILALSVAMRNYWYIQYFSLAYKRICVLLFLILTLYGLYTVYIKVRKKKSPFFLFRTNAYAMLVVLILSSGVNWDQLIARYNFGHAQTSFLHLNFMRTLSDKALPYLDPPGYDWNKTTEEQQKRFGFKKRYLHPDRYRTIIKKRKAEFIVKWESRSVLEWNLPEYLACKKLRKELSGL